jgi:hypothetical protein
LAATITATITRLTADLVASDLGAAAPTDAKK